MIIAVNTKEFPGSDCSSQWMVDCIALLAALQPSHQFIFIGTKELDEKITALKNVALIVLRPASANSLVLKLWYNYKLPALLKKHKADLVIHTNGICSLRCRLPQLLLANDMSLLQNPSWLGKKHFNFLQANAKAFLNKAHTILTTSNIEKDVLAKKYAIDLSKLQVLYPAPAKLFQPIDWKEKEAIKEKYAGGKEYFLFIGVPDERSNIITLLKAYSFFKKRQKSSMQLVLAIKENPANKAFLESLRLYKYRAEVQVLQQLPEKTLSKITAAAYAVVQPVLYENNITVLLNALQCQVPVITIGYASMHETLGSAALYAANEKMENIAEQMMLVFKDEHKRNEVIENGKERIKDFGWDKTVEALWELIVKVCVL
jgi:glycosyltransferase involved in cell wall biosynthesis